MCCEYSRVIGLTLGDTGAIDRVPYDYSQSQKLVSFHIFCLLCNTFECSKHRSKRCWKAHCILYLASLLLSLVLSLNKHLWLCLPPLHQGDFPASCRIKLIAVSLFVLILHTAKWGLILNLQ